MDLLDPATDWWSATPAVERWWLVLGFTAEFVFGLRFVLQWLASERAGRSTMPIAFWYLSVLGGSMLLAYAIWRADPVFIAGQGGGLAVYLRNLYLIHRNKVVGEAPAGE